MRRSVLQQILTKPRPKAEDKSSSSGLPDRIAEQRGIQIVSAQNFFCKLAQSFFPRAAGKNQPIGEHQRVQMRPNGAEPA
jgi:hypothetical protein